MRKRLLLVTVLCLCMVLLTACSGMDRLPEGERIKSVDSPDGVYRINAYLCDGGATTDYAVRCEVETVASGEKRNIYWQYHQENVTIKWKSDLVVDIGGKVLDVTKDSYDWRND